MDFYLTAPDGSRLHFPINPERITVEAGNKTQTYSIVNLGDIVIPRGIVPARFSFEGFFPGELRKNASYVKDWRHPKELINLLERWKNNNTKLRLLVTETTINHDVYFDGEGSLQYEFKGGHGDCYYSLKLIEARNLVVMAENELKTKVSASSKGKTTTKRPTPPPPKIYTVKPGDSLWAIAKKTLGDGSKWKTIYELNKKVIGPDPNKIRPGMQLRIS
ncbi:Peptidoglycan-binding lysin domain protein [Caldicellulosiruptor hydrothermalis 108]|uniref:Peptidoglycan-binding lysin domain protein n=1 Tax=Caldicellulosiruptor hydrothermalis (strain DSM 18901 / VKM B-2411 / 108) TaxID=632292 RepID=E4QE22_CALH1|nr:LysM peptidoglycan-binding domain-containing protein [Caldicellulosiruptor hydrothermalis]ADQ06516.1 Peptidoglycan-binding lysin domain protein [Caldicellulosiruptor hydrothermalis 108]